MKIVMKAGLFIGALLMGGTAGYSQSKIAYIDFQYLLSQVQSIDDVQSELQKLSSEWTARIESMQDSVAQMEKDMETMSITLTKTGKQVLEKGIADAKAKIAAYQEQKFSPASGELYKKQQELIQPIIDKLKRAVDNVRIRERLDAVFDISTGNPVSIDKRFDLTALVIEEFSVVGLLSKQQQRDRELQKRNEPKNDPNKR